MLSWIVIVRRSCMWAFLDATTINFLLWNTFWAQNACTIWFAILCFCLQGIINCFLAHEDKSEQNYESSVIFLCTIDCSKTMIVYNNCIVKGGLWQSWSRFVLYNCDPLFFFSCYSFCLFLVGLKLHFYCFFSYV